MSAGSILQPLFHGLAAVSHNGLSLLGLLVLVAGVIAAIAIPVRGPVKGMIICFAMAVATGIGGNTGGVVLFVVLGCLSAAFGRFGS